MCLCDSRNPREMFYQSNSFPTGGNLTTTAYSKQRLTFTVHNRWEVFTKYGLVVVFLHFRSVYDSHCRAPALTIIINVLYLSINIYI